MSDARKVAYQKPQAGGWDRDAAVCYRLWSLQLWGSQRCTAHAQLYMFRLELADSPVLAHCRSFRLEDGTGPQLYAADVVYAVTALLEAPPAVRPGDAAQPDDKADHFWCGTLAHRRHFRV